MANTDGIDVDRLSELAAIISQNTEHITASLSTSSLPFPSFRPSAPQHLPAELSASSKAVIGACDELKRLMQGPKEVFHDSTQQNLMSLHLIVSFGIAKVVPIGGFATFPEIAQKTGLSEHLARRVIRHAATFYIFYEHSKGLVGHTAASTLLAQDEHFGNFLDVNLGQVWPAASQTTNAVKKWPESQSYSHSGFSYSKSDGDSLFGYLRKSPGEAKKFASGMSVFGSTEEYSTKHLVAYPTFENPCLVVDVGGSIGQTMKDLILERPSLHVVVQDLAGPIANHVEPPASIPGKMEFIVHDFFNEQPVKGADIYLLRLVLHNWNDHDCKRILKALIPALKPGSRILVNEWCLPEPNTIPKVDERRVRGMDMHMLSLLNTCERDADDWETLFRQTDPRFQLRSIHTPPGPSLSIIEVVWTG